MPFYFKGASFPKPNEFEAATRKKFGTRSRELKEIGDTLHNLHADINSLPRAQRDAARTATLLQSIDDRLTQLAKQVKEWKPDGEKAKEQQGLILGALGHPAIALFRSDMRLIQQGRAPAPGTAAQPSTSSTAPPYPQPPQMPPQFQMQPPPMQSPSMPQGAMTPQFWSPAPTAWSPMQQHSQMHPSGSMRAQPDFGGQPPYIPQAFQQHPMAPVSPFVRQPMSPQQQQYRGMPPRAHGVDPRASAFSQRPIYSQQSAPNPDFNDPRVSYTPTELRESYGSNFDLGRDSGAMGGREISMVAGSGSYGSPVSARSMSYPNSPWGSPAAYGTSPPQSGHWSWGAQPAGQQPNWGAESMHSGPEMEYGSSRASMDTIDGMNRYAQEVGSNVDRLEAQRQRLLSRSSSDDMYVSDDEPQSNVRQTAGSTSHAAQASSSSQPFGAANSPPSAQAAGYSLEESESYVPPIKAKTRGTRVKKTRR